MKLVLAPNISHDQNNNFEPHFNYLDQTNAVVLLMMPVASLDVGAGASGIT